VGLFEVHETTRAIMAIQLKALLAWYELLDKVIAYVKDENANMNTLTMALTNIVSCDPFMFCNPMLPFNMGMPCLSAINMLQMTSRCVVECKTFLSRLIYLLCQK
jgi:hypothetical protein